jgi:hypothetical protein
VATPPIVAPGAFVAIDAGYCRVRRPSFAIGYNSAATIVQVLKQAADDLSRENIMQEDAFVMVALASTIAV